MQKGKIMNKDKIINVYSHNLNNEYQIQILIGAVNLLMEKANIAFSDEEINKLNQEALEFLQKKYPDNNIHSVKEGVNDNLK